MAYIAAGAVPAGIEYEDLTKLAQRARAGNRAAFRALADMPPHIQTLAWMVEPEWTPEIQKASKEYRDDSRTSGGNSLRELIAKAGRGGPAAPVTGPSQPPPSPGIPADIAENLRSRDASGSGIYADVPAEREAYWELREQQRQRQERGQ